MPGFRCKFKRRIVGASAQKCMICDYYSFKIFHLNQLLFTKFGKNLRHIESMTSKVEPTENY